MCTYSSKVGIFRNLELHVCIVFLVGIDAFVRAAYFHWVHYPCTSATIYSENKLGY